MTRIAALLLLAVVESLAQTTPIPPAGGARPKAAVGKAASTPAAIPTYKELKFPELQSIAPPPMESLTLPNGLRLYLMEDHELPLVNGTVLVRTGSLLDPPGKNGLAALTLQVMVNGGSGSHPGDDAMRRFQALGAELDGSVTGDSASISFSALRDSSDEVLDALKDLLIAPEFQQERLDFAESHMRNTIAHRNDDPAGILRREFISTVFGKDTPYGARIDYSNLDRINRADLVSFHQRYFFPRNVMLALHGDFDPARMKARIDALFGEWKSDQLAVPPFPKPSTEANPGKYLAVKKDTPLAYFSIGQMGGDYQDKDYPALQIMADILGGGTRGRLPKKLRDKADNVSARWAAGYGRPGVFEVSGAMDPFHLSQVLQTIYLELNAIRTAEVTEEELATARNAALNSLVFTFDGQLSMMPRLAQYEYYNLPKDYTRQLQKSLAAVTRADVLRVAKEHLDPARMTTMVVANPTGFEVPLELLGGTVTAVDLTIPQSKVVAVLGDPASQRQGKQLLARAQQAMGGADKLAAVNDVVQEISLQFDASAGGAQSTMTERWMASGNLRQDSNSAGARISVYSDGKTGWIVTGQGSAALAGVNLKLVQGDLFRVIFSLLLSDRVPGRKVNALDKDTVEISEAGQIAKLVFDANTGLLKSLLYDVPNGDAQVPVLKTYSDYRTVSGLKIPTSVAVTVAGNKYQDWTVKSTGLNTGLKLADLERRP